jgi:hypothetical protein
MVREGARRLLQHAIKAEVSDYVDRHSGEVDERGRHKCHPQHLTISRPGGQAWRSVAAPRSAAAPATATVVLNSEEAASAAKPRRRCGEPVQEAERVARREDLPPRRPLFFLHDAAHHGRHGIRRDPLHAVSPVETAGLVPMEAAWAAPHLHAQHHRPFRRRREPQKR